MRVIRYASIVLLAIGFALVIASVYVTPLWNQSWGAWGW
jgi:hypothetical protein